jgi:hypothetical protein
MKDENANFVVCPVCGHDVFLRFGRGRPAEYHPECRRIENLFSWLENLLSVIDAKLLFRSRLRGRLFRLANYIK